MKALRHTAETPPQCQWGLQDKSRHIQIFTDKKKIFILLSKSPDTIFSKSMKRRHKDEILPVSKIKYFKFSVD